MSMTLTYTALAARSTFRNARFLIFTVALPLVMYLMFNMLYGHQAGANGLTVGAYLMVSMATYGGIGATMNSGARVAVERQTGWNRQLRLSALTPTQYVVSRAAVSLLVALPAIVLVFLAGAVIGHVSLPVGTWLSAGVGVWLALIPFSVIGLAIGFLGTVDSVQPITMLVYMAMAILGGLWFPVNTFPSFLQHIAKGLPSYWAAEVGRDVLARAGVPLTGIIVLTAWTLVMAALAALSYRRSGRRS